MKQLIFLACGAAALAAAGQLLIPGSGSAQNRPAERDAPLITASAAGESRREPDEATVRLGVVAQDRSARVAQSRANEIASSILAAVKRLGVEQKQITSTRISLQPIYAAQRPDQIEAPRIAAYRASNSVSVRLLDLSKAGPVIDAGLEAGANTLEGVTFGLQDDTRAREEALRQAAVKARAKAETMARALGVRLGPLQNVQEGGVDVRPVPPMMIRSSMAAESNAPVSPGEIEVGASVTVQYRIEQ